MEQLLILTYRKDTKRNVDSLAYSTIGKQYFCAQTFTEAKPGLAILDGIVADRGGYAFVDGHMYTPPTLFNNSKFISELEEKKQMLGITDTSGSTLYSIGAPYNIAYIKVNNSQQDDFILYVDENSGIASQSSNNIERAALNRLSTSNRALEVFSEVLDTNKIKVLTKNETLLLASRMKQPVKIHYDRYVISPDSISYITTKNRYVTLDMTDIIQDPNAKPISSDEIESFCLVNYITPVKNTSTTNSGVDKIAMSAFGQDFNVYVFGPQATMATINDPEARKLVYDSWAYVDSLRTRALKKLGRSAIREASNLLPKHILKL